MEVVVVGVMMVFPIIVCDRGRTCLGKNHTFMASGLRNTIGSWSWEIHPLAQSIFGCIAANHRYPRMTLFSPRSDKKYLRVCCVVPVLV